jgi:hypothetical protein
VIASAPDVFMNNHYFDAELPRRRHVLVSTLYYVLYDLSPPVLCYLLDRFDGRLSVLVDAFDAWAVAHGVEAADFEQLVAFCAGRFGATHHLTSLVRYMTALATMRRPTRRQVVRPRAPVRRGDAHVCNPDARMLGDIHDCATLLARIEALHATRPQPDATAVSPPPAGQPSPAGLIALRRHRGAAPLRVLDAQIAERWSAVAAPAALLALDDVDDTRGDLLVVPVTGTDRVRNLALHPDVRTLLELFAVPRSLGAVARLASGGERVLRDLVAIEALVPASATPSARAHRAPEVIGVS